MKTCTRCKERKGIEYFGADKSKTDGYASHCKQCRNLHEKSKRVAGERKYKYRKRDPAKQREYVIRCRYGLELHELQRMVDNQDNRCAICSKELTRYHIDHDHSTGEVRGLLCASCNSALGKLDDSIEILQNAIDYLFCHQTKTNAEKGK